MKKIYQSSSGSQVYPIFPGAVLHWQRTVTNVLHLKWTVPCRLGENWAKNLLFSWAVLQVKSPIMAHVHPWSLEGGCAWSRNSDYSLSSLVSRKIQHRTPLPLTESATVLVATSHCYPCFTARDSENRGKLSAVLFPCPCNQKKLALLLINIKYVIHWCFCSMVIDIQISIYKKFGWSTLIPRLFFFKQEMGIFRNERLDYSFHVL